MILQSGKEKRWRMSPWSFARGQWPGETRSTRLKEAVPLASADRRAAMGQGRGQARVGWRIADPEWLPATRDRGIVGSWSGVVDTVDMFFRERRAIALCKNLAHQTPELHTFILPGPALDPLGGKAVRDSPWVCRFVSSARRLTSGALRRRAMAAVSARRSRSPLTKGAVLPGSCLPALLSTRREAGDERGRRQSQWGLPSRPRSSNNFTSRLPFDARTRQTRREDPDGAYSVSCSGVCAVLVRAASCGGTSNSRRKETAAGLGSASRQ